MVSSRLRSVVGGSSSWPKAGVVDVFEDVWAPRTASVQRATCPLTHLARPGNRGRLKGAFVFRRDVDTSLVAFAFRKRRGEKSINDGQRVLDGVHSRPDADYLSVVMLTSQRRSFRVPRQGAADPFDFVCRDLLAVARAAQDNAAASGVADNAEGRGDAERWVVIAWVVGICTAVDRIVPSFFQVADDVLFEFISGMVGAQVDAHGLILTEGPIATGRDPVRPISMSDSPARFGVKASATASTRGHGGLRLCADGEVCRFGK